VAIKEMRVISRVQDKKLAVNNYLGKTTTAAKFPNSLLLAFEKGFNAIPGVMAQPINSWGDFRKVLKQLKDENVQEKFSTIIIDTADIAYDLCERYICENAKRSDGSFGVDSIGDIGYGKGYTLLAKEFDECLRSIVQMNYGLVLISHAVDKTFTDEQNREYNKIVPTLSAKAKNIVSRMADIIGYSRAVQNADGTISTKLFMRGTPRYEAGSRFKHTPDYIDFSYNNLVNALGEAIDKQAKEEGSEFFTDKSSNLYEITSQELDFDVLLDTFNSMINNLIEKDEDYFQSYWSPRITQIIERYLGKGQKVNNCSRDQVQALDLIITDLKELLNN
jgi:hypothetical protein